jgi:hypothetical protein
LQVLFQRGKRDIETEMRATRARMERIANDRIASREQRSIEDANPHERFASRTTATLLLAGQFRVRE